MWDITWPASLLSLVTSEEGENIFVGAVLVASFVNHPSPTILRYGHFLISFSYELSKKEQKVRACGWGGVDPLGTHRAAC